MVFDVVTWQIGAGFHVTVTMPGGEPKRITETFATEGEAWRWIRKESVAWLADQRGAS